jgi:putative flippase GtrA
VTIPAPALRAPLVEQVLRFGRSLVVGGGGTLLDLAAVFVSLRFLELDATWARTLGLCVGCVVMFFGSRSFAFRAESGSAVQQAKRFVISEAVGFPLNLLVFRLLLAALPNTPPEVLSVAANFALFVTYYYPVRNFVVFRARQAPVGGVVPAASYQVT